MISKKTRPFFPVAPPETLGFDSLCPRFWSHRCCGCIGSHVDYGTRRWWTVRSFRTKDLRKDTRPSVGWHLHTNVFPITFFHVSVYCTWDLPKWRSTGVPLLHTLTHMFIDVFLTRMDDFTALNFMGIIRIYNKRAPWPTKINGDTWNDFCCTSKSRKYM